MPRLICSIGRPTRLLPIPSRSRIARASRLADGTVEAVEPGREDQVLHRAELLEEGGVDADPVDQALDRHLVALDVVPEDLHPALVEGQETRDEADERRLARPVGAEDPVDVAALEAHRHVRDRRDRLLRPTHDETLADAVDEQGGDPGRDRPRHGPDRRLVALQLVDEGGGGHGGLQVEGGHGTSRGPRPDAASVGLAALMSSVSAWRRGRASKKPGARSGPRLVVCPEGGRAACG